MLVDHINQNNDDFTQYTLDMDKWLGEREEVDAVGVAPNPHLVMAAGRQPDNRSIFFFVGARDKWCGDDVFDVVVYTTTGQKKTMCFTISIRESCAT